MSVNKVILLGFTCRNPEIKSFDSGQKVANFSLATNKRAYKTANGTEVPEQTEFHNLVIWDKLADVAERYIKKGDKLYIEGELRTRTYEDKLGGAKRYLTEIYVSTLEMLSNKNNEVPPPAPPPQQNNYQQSTSSLPSSKDDDDLPF